MGGKIKVFHPHPKIERTEVGGGERGTLQETRKLSWRVSQSKPYNGGASCLQLFLRVGINEAGSSVDSGVRDSISDPPSIGDRL